MEQCLTTLNNFNGDIYISNPSRGRSPSPLSVLQYRLWFNLFKLSIPQRHLQSQVTSLYLNYGQDAFDCGESLYSQKTDA
jgi:hypothetical protein